MTQRRMLITLDDELHKTLKELAKVSGVPAARFAAELLKEAQPQFKSLIKAFKLAKTKPLEAIESISEGLTEAMHVGTKAQLEIIETKKELKHRQKQSKLKSKK